MRQLKTLACGVGLALAAAWAVPSLAAPAEEKKADPAAAHQHDMKPAEKAMMDAAHQHEMSAEEKAMMDAYAKAGTPGKQHEWLAKMAGSWDLTTKMWMAPGTEPEVSTGTAERKMALGGRVLTEIVHGTAMGSPFEGHGMSGYDNTTGKYWGTWNDSMSTALMTSTGTCDEATSTCTSTSTGTDPISGQEKTVRMVTKWNGDQETMEMWEPTPDGKEFKSFEIVYTRKK